MFSSALSSKAQSFSRRPGPLAVHGLLALGMCWLGACSSGDPEPAGEVAAPLPTQIVIEDPSPAISDMGIVEDMTEEAADRLLTFSDKLRRRDFSAAEKFIGSNFAGHDLSGLDEERENERQMGVRDTEFDVGSARIVDRDGMLAGLRDEIGPWSGVESVIWKVKRAEFQEGSRPWGKLKLYIHMTGRGPRDEWISVTAWGYARVVREKGKWVLEAFKLDSKAISSRSLTMFTDVSTAVGVAHTGARFGKPGNQSYAFNGAASGDVNGDGLWDIFVPSDGRNFLYLAQGDGTFSEEAVARGLAEPDAGTGAVLFDFDNDGDQDLLVGQIGWHESGGERAGRPMGLFLNDGKGTFEPAGKSFGLSDLRFAAYSLTVLDFDSDGWLDVFVCGYGRVGAEHNNSWIEATNGAANGLLRNLEGKGFSDVAGELGVRGTSWTYAAAAADFDQDGDPDLYVANDYGSNRLFRNDGGKFVDVAEAVGVRDSGNGMGVSFGDLNSDGRLDLYVSNMSSTAGARILSRLTGELDAGTHAILKKLSAGSSIFMANDSGQFERRPKSTGGVNGSWAWSPVLVDLDLDGYLDVYCANGFVTGDQPFDT